jgi:methylenetetrahydrofolate--tRNA-(uracil-5-)-methyltransferase
MRPVHVIGAGLAGSECAFQLAARGIPVVLHEMRPERMTPAHSTGWCAELVCTNSLRSDDPEHAAGLLKREMESFGSLVIGAARASAVPGGSALVVDRDQFSARITATLERMPGVTIERHEVTDLPDGDVVVATGPLTSPALTERIQGILGSEHLYFYDSIAPIVEADSLDTSRMFWASRYGKGEGDDYLNVPLTREEYLAFHQELITADVVELHEFEKNLFFEGCLPIEEMARRGVDVLQHGPMKPVGLTPPDGSKPYAVLQLRQENLSRSQFNMVGFQTRMKWSEQRRVFRTLPGFADAKFARFGQVHRNTFINAPLHLDELYRLRKEPRVRLAGQITGVEGYLESAAAGLVVALYVALERRAETGQEFEPLPTTTALGALARHLTQSDPRHFQPSNIQYGLFSELTVRLPRRKRRAAYADRARRDLEAWRRKFEVPAVTPPAVDVEARMEAAEAVPTDVA